ncbi:MAG: ABC transporter ATP-binding protein, partial [Gammaproteobacteria bacterium]|nr:ABC transporter ATP-binding protein [Gammaproteobacteria bacterium]
MSQSSTPSMPSLATQSLGMSYGTRQVIDGLDISLPSGQVTAIVGPNGCGKSTLLAGLARLHKPDSGAVLLDGADIQRLPTRQLATQLALLPQEAVAPEGLTVTELIRFGRQPHQGWLRQWSAEDQRVVQHALAAAGLEQLADRPIDALSGGQRQRVWIAMTIAQQTSLLSL